MHPRPYGGWEVPWQYVAPAAIGLLLTLTLAVGGVVGQAHGTRVKWTTISTRLASLTATIPTHTASSAPAPVLPKVDATRPPPERKAAVGPPSPTPTIPVVSPLPSSSTLATHYAANPPQVCYDAAGAHAVRYTRMFAAMRGVPCGTTVILHGPIGTVQIVIWDHGPNCSCPERGLDASNDAFAATVGPLSQGIGRVEWHWG